MRLRPPALDRPCDFSQLSGPPDLRLARAASVTYTACGFQTQGVLGRQTGGMADEHGFPDGFFDRSDPARDAEFYAPPRLVTHIDDGAIAAVGDLYVELGITGTVLDVMSSWVSHFREPPAHLTVLGMNAHELAANPQAHATVVHDLNADPLLPFADESFDAAVCCVSVDYLVRPIEVFAEIARTLRPGGLFVCTFSNRCFPTKAIRGWLVSSDEQHCEIVARYFALAGGFEEPNIERRTPPAHRGDPLFAVWARRLP
jgi:SAM-dependent methyltransferase